MVLNVKRLVFFYEGITLLLYQILIVLVGLRVQLTIKILVALVDLAVLIRVGFLTDDHWPHGTPHALVQMLVIVFLVLLERLVTDPVYHGNQQENSDIVCRLHLLVNVSSPTDHLKLQDCEVCNTIQHECYRENKK